jgi:glutamate-5-semialdehyde dehydrogenase
MKAATALEDRQSEILAANTLDCSAALAEVKTGLMSQAMLDRLKISERGIGGMATRVREVAKLPDPLGRSLAVTQVDEGLALYKESCPLGVVAIIFESRPDVIPQVASLALKSGNSVLLKGGREAAQTNETLVKIWRDTLSTFLDVPEDAINLFLAREDVAGILKLDDEIDLIIPRGSRELVRYVAEHSRIPVLGHGEGICHVYVDAAADLSKALEVTFDSKVQYPAACNAAETLLVHSKIAGLFLPRMIEEFAKAGVEMRGCPRTVEISPSLSSASETDWSTEYSDLIISIKIVDNLDEAIDHIHRYGSKHTESIVTEDRQAAARFLEEIDAAGVYHNASTRFADGYRYGLGAELGISTGKLHARGPVGLEGLTTYKYRLIGDGHTVAQYNAKLAEA